MPSRIQDYTFLVKEDPDCEKDTPEDRKQWPRRRQGQWLIPALLLAIAFSSIIFFQLRAENDDVQFMAVGNPPACPQFPAFESSGGEKGNLEQDIKATIESDGFFDKSLNRMQGAVRIATESFDDMGPIGEDGRWDIFKEFHTYLEKTFPLVYKNLKYTPINTHGILLEWKGTDDSLKPYLFMAHQDVVPVLKATESRWTHPPYEAHYDGRYLWGRGAGDCKNILIGLYEAMETLLEKGFTPTRTILAAYGFDEEIRGPRGAAHIAKYLEEYKGKDSIELIIDEGGMGVKEIGGTVFAMPALGEKGWYDVQITVETGGGHSSIPPDHTGIGILSQIISAIEATPYKPDLTPRNPFFTALQCTAEYSPKIDPWLHTTIKKALKSKKAAKTLAKYLARVDKFQRYLMQTSQATDIISGGVKVNALPEKVYAVIDHRIAVESSVSDVRSKIKAVVTSQILTKFAMSLDAWGKVSGNTSSSSLGSVTLQDFGTDEPLEPSPVSPFNSSAYKTLTGTIKQVLGEDVIVAPSLMTGNTDTRHYWSLSKNIYRFGPMRAGGSFNIHTVDERLGMKEHIEGVKFYAQFIINGDRI